MTGFMIHKELLYFRGKTHVFFAALIYLSDKMCHQTRKSRKFTAVERSFSTPLKCYFNPYNCPRTIARELSNIFFCVRAKHTHRFFFLLLTVNKNKINRKINKEILVVLNDSYSFVAWN